ncbi:helix-turn-helix domain-containing protein, partial [Streptomyces globisporus]
MTTPGITWLRQARDARGWTQDELAGRMGCSGTHISAVET